MQDDVEFSDSRQKINAFHAGVEVIWRKEKKETYISFFIRHVSVMITINDNIAEIWRKIEHGLLLVLYSSLSPDLPPLLEKKK